MNVGVKFKVDFDEVKKGLKDIQQMAKAVRMDGAAKDVEKLSESFKKLNDSASSVAGEVLGISETIAQLANSLGDADSDLLTDILDSLDEEGLDNAITSLEQLKAEALKAVEAAEKLNAELGSPESEIQLEESREKLTQIADLLHEVQSRANAIEFEKMKDEIEKSYSALDRLKQKLEEIDRKAEETDVSKPFKLGTFNVRRFAMSLIGMQSVFSLISKSTRQYMESNNALKSSMLGVTSAIGDLFAPLLKHLISLMQSLIRATMTAIAYFKTFMNVIFGTNMQIRYTLKATGQASKGFGKLGKSAKKAGKAMKKAIKGQVADIDELNIITSDTTDNVDDMGSGAGGMGDMGDFVVPDMTPFDITDKITQLQKFAEWLERNRDWVKALTLALAGFAIAVTVITWIGKIVGALQLLKGWSIEGTIVWQAFSKGLAVIFSPIGLVIGLLAAVGVAIYQLWQESEEFRNAWDTIWNGIKSIVNTVYESILKPILETLVDLFSFVVEHGLKPVWEAFKFLVERVTIAIATVMEVIAPLVAFMGEVFKPIFEGVLNVVGTAFKTVFGFITSIVAGMLKFLGGFIEGVADIFAGVAKLLYNVFLGDWDGVFEAIKQLARGFIKALGSIFLGIGTFVVNMFKAGGTIFKGFTQGVADVFKRLVNLIIRGINRVISSPFTAINRALNRFSGISILGKRPFGFIGYNPVPVPSIPQLATGAELRNETTATMAEYVGAKNNPEIVSPQSIMAETIGSELDKRLGAFAQDGGDLQLVVYVDGKKKVEEMVEDYNKYKMRGGKLSFVGG